MYVRYSYDHWRNYNEAQASYILGSCDGYSDQFSFLLEADSLMDHDALIFCVRYRTVNQQEYWDNNGGRNYVIKCFGASAGGASGAAKISEGYRGSSSYLQVPSYWRGYFRRGNEVYESLVGCCEEGIRQTQVSCDSLMQNLRYIDSQIHLKYSIMIKKRWQWVKCHMAASHHKKFGCYY